MFKLIIILGLFAVALAYSSTERTLSSPDPKKAEHIRQSIIKCYGNPNIKHFLIMLKEGKYLYNADFQELTRCTFYEAGFSRKDGSVIKEKALQLYRGKEDLVSDVIEKCSKVGGDNPTARSFGFYKCFQDETPCFLNLEEEKN